MVPDRPPTEFTTLLRRVAIGDGPAWDELLTELNGTLQQIAHRMIATERAGHTLETAALVNEAYLKLTNGAHNSWEDRVHFERAAACAMRHVLIDHARARGTAKRGGDKKRVPLSDVSASARGLPLDVLSMNQVLEQLRELDPEAASVVDLHCFAGLSHEETAHNLGMTKRSTERSWRFARSWIESKMKASR